MTLKSQLYLLQLEDYDLARYHKWISDNPGREVLEKKGKIKWTWKAILLYWLGKYFGLEKAFKIVKPIDTQARRLVIFLAKTKIAIFHGNLITVGVTGSWGKTTTKEKLAAILRTKYRVAKTFGNNNTFLGVAINVLSIPLNTQIFVCEMGAYKMGDIREICKLVRPKVGIITAIGPMHLERFGDLDSIKRTKEEVWENIPADGLKIGPNDDLVGKIAEYFQLETAPVKECLANFTGAKNRLEVSENGGVTIIDDSYNSNPVGFEMALNLLKETFGSPKILVTPGMIELGREQEAANRTAAQLAEKIADVIVFVGETNKKIWQETLAKSKLTLGINFVKDMDEAKGVLSVLANPGAVVLFENDLPDQYF